MDDHPNRTKTESGGSMNSQGEMVMINPGPPYVYTYHEDDGINIFSYLELIWNRRLLLTFVVFIAGAASIGMSLLLPNIYRSSATIIPRENETQSLAGTIGALGGMGDIAGGLLGLSGGSGLEKLEIVLQSRILAKRIYDDHKSRLLEAFYEEEWDEKNQQWIAEGDDPPTEQDITELIHDSMTVKIDSDKGILICAFDHKDPDFAKTMVEQLIVELSEILREEALKEAKKNQKFLNEQMTHISDILLKEKILSLLASEIEKETLARVQQPYGFQILDPPIVPDSDKQLRPERIKICVVTVALAVCLSIFLIFAREFIRNQKNHKKSQIVASVKSSSRSS